MIHYWMNDHFRERIIQKLTMSKKKIRISSDSWNLPALWWNKVPLFSANLLLAKDFINGIFFGKVWKIHLHDFEIAFHRFIVEKNFIPLGNNFAFSSKIKIDWESASVFNRSTIFD